MFTPENPAVSKFLLHWLHSDSRTKRGRAARPPWKVADFQRRRQAHHLSVCHRDADFNPLPIETAMA